MIVWGLKHCMSMMMMSLIVRFELFMDVCSFAWMMDLFEYTGTTGVD